MAAFERARSSGVELWVNGRDGTELVTPRLVSATYTDVASGEGDTLDIELDDRDGKWIGGMCPRKGDVVTGALLFRNWKRPGRTERLDIGAMHVDEASFSGGPLTAKVSATSANNCSSFRTAERTKTWAGAPIRAIASEIAARNGLAMSYDGWDVLTGTTEQSQETDCAFLSKVCEKYGFSMKVYSDSIVLFDQLGIELRDPVATLTRSSFAGDSWSLSESLDGTYTGARVSYKDPASDGEISIYIGNSPEDAPDARVMNITERAESVADARWKAAVEVNKSNEGAVRLSGDLFPDPSVCAGCCVDLRGFGFFDGKYYIDKVKTTVSGSGASQTIEGHKCLPRISVAALPQEEWQVPE